MLCHKRLHFTHALVHIIQVIAKEFDGVEVWGGRGHEGIGVVDKLVQLCVDPRALHQWPLIPHRCKPVECN